MLLPEDIQIELEMIDATLAGEPVDPEYAELAELALLLVAERPAMPEAAAERLDARAARRFEPRPVPRALRPQRRRLWSPAFGGVAGAIVAVAVIAVLVVGGGGGGSSSSNSSAGGSSSAASSAFGSGSSGPAAATNGSTYRAPATTASGPLGPKTSGADHQSLTAIPNAPAVAGTTGAASSSSAPSVAAPAPTPNGRKITQSAQLQLIAAAGRIDAVSQEVFNVVGQVSGIVKSSQVSSGTGAYASFALSIPTGNLQTAMTRLSALPYAHVSSRTDQTQDVNSQYLNDTRTLADARALRTALLRQLAAASTPAEIDSLTARIHDAEASIRSDEATLSSLNGRISYSSLAVQINAGAPVSGGRHPASGGGLTFGRASHDAWAVLRTAAGVALIALAALVPVALLAGLFAWLALTWRRRQREQALDAT